MEDFIKRDSLWINVAREAYKAQKLRKQYEELEKKLLEQLKEVSENKSSFGGGFKFQCIERKGSIDYGSIEMLKTINLEQYRRDSTQSWKLFKE
jgi:hypothetical protein